MVNFILSLLLTVPLLGNSSWTALSDTAMTASPVMKSEVAMSGNNLYIAWLEDTNSDNKRVMRFRRSGDLGQTWDETQLINEQHTSSGYARENQLMAAADNNVYLLSQDNETYMLFYHSSDYGQTFQRTILDTIYSNESRIQSYLIKAEGKDVVVAWQKTLSKAGIYVAVSHDAGLSFQDTVINNDEECSGTNLYDLTLSNGRWCVMHHKNSWYVNLQWGKVYVTSGHDKDFTTTKVNPLTNLDQDKSIIWSLGSKNYHPSMFQQGDTIHAVFDGQVVDTIPIHTLYRRSDDGGLTWTDPVIINGKAEDGNHKQVIARNGHVYICNINASSRVTVHASHDNGVTWEDMDDLTAPNGSSQYWGGTEDYSIQFDPNDPSGLGVYLVATRLMWIYSRDGFRTTSAANSFGFYVYDTNGSNTWGHVLVDATGKRHFFVRTVPDRNHNKNSVLHYHGEGGWAPRSGETAIHLQKESEYYNKNLITITPAEDLRIDSAITVSIWVKIDSAGAGLDLVWHNLQTNQKATNYELGWCIRYNKWSKGWYFETALCTDKSDDRKATCLSSNTKWDIVQPGTWHNVTFTYDARMGGNNYRMYMDGMLMGEANLTGRLGWGFSPICLGPGDTGYAASFTFDDFQIWDCALTPDEVRQLPFKDDIRKEHRVLWLDFNNTLADASGHGHGAVPMFDYDFTPHKLSAPHPSFDAIVEGKRMTAVDMTPDGEAFFWQLGDSYTDTLRHPQHSYYSVGDYNVQMMAYNDEKTAWGTEQVVSIFGIERMEPRTIGNCGYFYPTIYGGGLNKNINQIFLVKNGVNIPCDSLLSFENSQMKVRFCVEQAELGFWDLAIGKDTLRRAVNITNVDSRFLPGISLTGREKLLKNKWQTYTFTCSNRNNVAMYQVPVYIFIQDCKDLEVEFINFEMGEPVIEGMPAEYQDHLRDSIGEYTMGRIWNRNIRDSVTARVYPLILPVLEANNAVELRIRVRANEDVYVLGAISDALMAEQGAYRISYEEWESMQMVQAVHYNAPARVIRRVEMNDMVSKGECMMQYLGRGVISATAGAVPGLDCVVGVGFNIYDLRQDYKSNNKNIVSNALWNFGGTAVSCAASFLGPVVGFFVGGVTSMICNYHTVKDCLGDNNNTDKSVRSVSSLDPNEMVGPTGAGEQHWIKPNTDLDYTIFFENKSTATAPAHTVTVCDTLDLTKVDLSTFGFTTFAWGDTTFSIEGQNVREFTRDVDLRPGKELIVRVSGKLDTISGIIDWAIISLNPVTRQEEEDPDLGFLPPNDEKGIGEGYVGFRAGQKTDLASGSDIANKATIIFDGNDPIATNRFVNHIDAVDPVSKVISVEAVGDSLLLTFSGTDNESGIASYEVWAQINDTLTGVIDAGYVGNTMRLPVMGKKMGFWIAATDMVGWHEQKEHAAEIIYEATGIEPVIRTDSNGNGSETIKVLENGQIVIIRDGVRYTATGITVR